MRAAATAGLKPRLDRVLAGPTLENLWELYKEPLAIDGDKADAARSAVRAFHACLRNFDSKTVSRSASRRGAVLGTAAVDGVSSRSFETSRTGRSEGCSIQTSPTCSKPAFWRCSKLARR